jgi:capsular exopolysaccharide synthesis family protein
VDYDSDTPNTPNFLLAAWRRWPWLIVGVMIGTVLGFLVLYLARPPIYQSAAQVLVVKKRPDVVSGSDSRMALLDDYVATQVTLIRSERILEAAAVKVSADRLEDPVLRAMALDSDPRRPRLMGYMQSQLSVAREKDPSSPAGVTNVLNLAIRGSNARDCQYLLETIITTYQTELGLLYDVASDEKIQQYDSLNRQFESQIAALAEERNDALEKINRITPEDLPAIRLRVSKQMDLLRELESMNGELTSHLKLINAAGPDPRKRALILAQISDPGRGQVQITKTDVDNPTGAIRELEYQRVEMSKTYGPDHAMIQGLDAKIAFLKDLAQAKYEADPTGVLSDALAVYGEVLAYRQQKTQDQIAKVESNLTKDMEDLKAANSLQNQIEENTRKITDLGRKIEENQILKTQTLVTKSAGGYQATEINKPNLNNEPVSPKLAQSLLLGAAGGLLLGLGLAALAELADKSFRSPAEIRARLGLPIVGHIPPIRVGLDSEARIDVEPSVVCAIRPKSVEAEAYRGVRTALYFSTHGRGHQVIQVTSPNPGDGKSTLASNLAVSVAQSGKRVLLVDCDFRRPRQHKIFRLAESGPGFTAVIVGESTLGAAVRRTVVENLTILPCGTRPANPAELLTSPQFAAIVEQARAEYDFVILDTPPMLAVSDPSVVAPRADGVLLVFRMTNRVRPQAERAREQLAQLGANVLGVVVNGAGRSTDGYGYGYGYAYGSGYHYEYEYTDAYHDDDVDTETEPYETVAPKKG